MPACIQDSPPPFRLRTGVLVAAALLIGPAFASTAPAAESPVATHPSAHVQSHGKKAAVAAKKTPAHASAAGKAAGTEVAKGHAAQQHAALKGKSGASAAVAQGPGPLADFAGVTPAPEVAKLANWVSYSRNSGKRAFVVIDKKAAQMYVFEPTGKLKSRSPVLLGKAVGDYSAPGVGDKPLSQLKESEKTTPAGRFVAIPGKNSHGANIIWIDYKAAVSMHATASMSAAERRGERMNAAAPEEHRISNGCVNVPPAFFNSVVRPTVLKYGAMVYVLPETTRPEQMFGAMDVPANAQSVQVAQAAPATPAAKKASR